MSAGLWAPTGGHVGAQPDALPPLPPGLFAPPTTAAPATEATKEWLDKNGNPTKNVRDRVSYGHPYGAGVGAASATAPGQVPSSGAISTSVDPAVTRAIGRYEDRFKTDTTDRAIQRSTLATISAAELAAAGAKGHSLGPRGLIGSQAGDSWLADRIYNPAVREASGKAADIAIGRERDLDALSTAGTSLVTAPDSIANAQRAAALSAQNQTWSQNFATAQATQAANEAALNRIMQIYGSYA